MPLQNRDGRPGVEAVEQGHDAASIAPDAREALIASGGAGSGVAGHVVIPRHGDDSIGRHAKVVGHQLGDEFVPTGFATALSVAREQHAIQASAFCRQSFSQPPEREVEHSLACSASDPRYVDLAIVSLERNSGCGHTSVGDVEEGRAFRHALVYRTHGLLNIDNRAPIRAMNWAPRPRTRADLPISLVCRESRHYSQEKFWKGTLWSLLRLRRPY